MYDFEFSTRAKRSKRSGGHPRLRTFRLDDSVRSEAGSTIEVTLTFSDGSRRWCLVTTTEYLVALKRTYRRSAHAGHHLIVVDSLCPDTVEKVLFDLDSQSLLIEQTCPLA